MARRDAARITPALARRFNLTPDTVNHWNGLSASDRYRLHGDAITDTRRSVRAEVGRGALSQRGVSGRGSSLAAAASDAHGTVVARARERRTAPIRQMAQRTERQLWRRDGIAIINDQLYTRDEVGSSMSRLLDNANPPLARRASAASGVTGGG